MVKKERYDLTHYVFKKEDVDAVVQANPFLGECLSTLQSLIKIRRIQHNKRPVNTYLVCNNDEPYADNVWAAIVKGEDEKK